MVTQFTANSNLMQMVCFANISSYFKLVTLCVCPYVCVCLCVCDAKRERERGGEIDNILIKAFNCLYKMLENSKYPNTYPSYSIHTFVAVLSLFLL